MHFFYNESKSKKKKIFLKGGGGDGRTDEQMNKLWPGQAQYMYMTILTFI